MVTKSFLVYFSVDILKTNNWLFRETHILIQHLQLWKSTMQLIHVGT